MSKLFGVLLLALIGHTIGIFGAFYVYDDSRRRWPNRLYGIAWSILVYLFFIISFWFYLLLRPPAVFENSKKISTKNKIALYFIPIIIYIIFAIFYALFPLFSSPHYSIGESYYKKRMFDKAITELSISIEKEPNVTSLAYGLRAMAYLEKGEFNKSWEDVHKAEELGLNCSRFIEVLKKASGREQ